MKAQRLTMFVAVASVMIVALMGAFSSGLARAADPDFSNVPDILGGQTHLLRDDDLVLGQLPNFQQYEFLTQGLQIASQSATTVVSSPCGGSLPNPPPFQTRVGRLFNLKNDVIINLAPLSTAGSGCSGSPNLGFYIQDPQNAANKSLTNLTVSPNFNQIALADFNGDGYADIFYLNDQFAVVFTAANTGDPTKGFTNVAQLSLGAQYAPRADPVTGDFNGDGAIDVAWPGVLNGEWFIYVASVCPAANAVVLGQTCTQAFQVILSTHRIDAGGDFSAKCTNIPSCVGNATVALSAGDYDGIPSAATGRSTAELAMDQVQIGDDGEVGQHVLTVFSFDATLNATARSSQTFEYGFPDFDLPFLASGRLGWFGQQEQLVFASAQSFGGGTNPQLTVIAFDTNLNMTTYATGFATAGGLPSVFGMAVGRFDPPDANGTTNPNLQIALMWATEGGGQPPNTNLELYTVNPPNDFTPQLASTHVVANQFLFPVDVNGLGSSLTYGNPLWAGDLQGRSLSLGPPTKVTVTGSLQPQVTLGLPPMHVDFIQDVNSIPNGPPTVLNLSTLPSKFFSQYQTQQSGSNQSSNTNTTSYTFATKESAEAKLSYGIPDLASVSVDLKTSAQQTHNNNVSTKYNTYSSKAFDVSTQTGFSDLVWFTAKRFNLYIYPVLGQLVCPQTQPNCTDAQKVPLHVEFSGPDQVSSGRIDGSQLEWYQPVQEPGNVFSYPWNAALLQNLYTGFDALTADPATLWATDSSGSTVSVTWTEGSGSAVTSGSVSTQSFDISTSVSASVNIEGFGVSASTGFDYNNSSSVSTLNESSSMVGSSTGIKIVKPSFANPADYAYVAATYIFGQQSPTGTVQQIPLNTAVQSNGPLWTAFIADPTDTGDGAGGWWSQAYTKPDVALNHPSRWTWTPPSGTKGDVLTFNPADPADPVLSEFYFMKGLYITPASANGHGSLITQAPVGTSLQLQARVYNYSLVDMPAGATVHVRFYGQEWDETAHNFEGAAFVINEVQLDPIPGFNSTSGGGTQPNWALAGTTFDTTNYADTYLIFWVVVWMEQNNQLVPEITGHGLTAIPGETTAPTAVALEAFSNNIGFYKQPFFVCARGVSCPTSSPQLGTATAASALAVDEVTIAPKKVQQFEKVIVTATLVTEESSLDGVLAFFYDGDPQHGGEAFDAELITHIRANGIYVTKVKFQPRTCGTHTVFVVAQGSAQATGTATVTVDCPPPGPPATTLRGKADGVGIRTSEAQLHLDGNTTGTPLLSLGSATLRLEALLDEVGGVGELVKKNSSGTLLLPLSLQAQAGSDEESASFETPKGVQPRVRVQIVQKEGKNVLRFSLKVDHASIPVYPALCNGTSSPTTTLMTRFTLTDGVHPAVVVSAEQPWECGKTKLKTP